MVFDTGSDWIVLQSTECSDCLGAKGFDKEKSATFQQLPGPETQLEYGSAALKGFAVEDEVCIGSLCLPKMEWFYVTEQVGMPA